MSIQVGWVAPPREKKGLDHLSVQAPCIHIYGQLLPGITNVTDRARYYSFYPWFFWFYEQRTQGTEKLWSDIVSAFRRADCLFTLIAMRHSSTFADTASRSHGALIGSRNLSKAAKKLNKGQIRISDYSSLESSQKYFKNKLGGLGQYYLSTLREFGLLKGDSTQGVTCTIERGKPIAKAFNNGVNGELFFQIIEKDIVTTADLDSLEMFCPCQIQHNDKELELLQKMFIDQVDQYEFGGKQRSESLKLLLHLVDQLNDTKSGKLSKEEYLGSLYSRTIHSGHRWIVPEALESTFKAWECYAKNEILSVFLQGVFWVALEELDQSENSFLTVEEFSDSFATTDIVHKTIGDKLDQPFQVIIDEARSSLPDVKDLHHKDHEFSLSVQTQLYAQAGEISKAFACAIGAFTAFAARSIEHSVAYENVPLPEGFLSHYPLNLESFYAHLSSSWIEMSMKEVVAWLINHWSLEAHLNVALRKLRGDSENSFRFIPTEQGLCHIASPEPVFTNPRFKQSMQILCDINMLKYHPATGSYTITKTGSAIIKGQNG